MRRIFLDTETTGFEHKEGDRLIELGCVEMQDRELTGHNLHMYFNVDRESNPDALKVHGITKEFLSDKPKFEEKVDEIIDYLKGAELIIHNASFDVGFLNAELARLNKPKIEEIAGKITDSLALAREKYPGKRNSLDNLCERLGVSNQHRVLHGALLDAELLAEVWLAMTKGQFSLDMSYTTSEKEQETHRKQWHLNVKKASEAETQEHLQYLEAMNAKMDWWKK
ncbi:DNA polymerase III subunit epsilon [Basilea psittacipulmonis]|uniref:DNA polymerase III subunit epsilon n=1 Tax=Basilea psittacipulmonis DSM 24701 TaxID=1072685 RepID=A0A077DIR6_9BURK|nr:DNA polymerase III subunit epsilon [Basilea psittacipulmonis]AIL33053.1 DNA polymerase III subunit epsilon [Basilea psittacipulmonis DSM 24701]